MQQPTCGFGDVVGGNQGIRKDKMDNLKSQRTTVKRIPDRVNTTQKRSMQLSTKQ